jgi:outer membrane lipase/esterase
MGVRLAAFFSNFIQKVNLMSFRLIPVRSALALALAAATLPSFAQSEYSNTVFFGDSLTDSGAFRPALVQIAGPSAAVLGRFTTNPGWVWAEHLADFYGHPADAVASNQGGDNFAVGGARVAADTAGPFGTIPSLTTQVKTYLNANGGRADANALYTVWGGANDLFAVVAGEPQTTIVTAVTAQIGIIGQLQQAGAQYVLAPNIPDLGKTPQFLAGGAVGMATGTQLATAYNSALYAGLQSAGLRVIPLDTFGFLGEVIANPSAFGYANVTSPACGAVSSVQCSPADYAGIDPNTYLFADGVHPSARTHEILAQYAESVLEGPRQIAVLPLSAANTGFARADMVAQHVDGKPAADGTRWWGNLRSDRQLHASGDIYSGGTPAGSFGVDWSRGSMVFGGFLGYGSGTLNFGAGAGSFKQSETSIGGFLGWYGERAWVNGQVSYSNLSYKVDRVVQLGPVARRHGGSPDGNNLTSAFAAGFTFGNGAMQHGPVISAVLQNIKVNGYAEDNPASTALSYPEQKFDSLIGSIGWQARYTINDQLQPYAQLTRDHAYKNAPQQVFAQLQNIPQAGDYAVPGLQVDPDYATLRVGVRTKLFGLDANIGASSTTARKGGDNLSAFITLGGNF